MAQNKLFYGDNLEILRKYIKDETVDLCYIDPPFNSKRNYNQIYNNVGKEDVAQAQAFIDTWTWNHSSNESLEDIINNTNTVFTKQSIQLISGLEKVLGRGSLFAYLVSMTQRIAEIHRVLKPTGSFYLHCDPTASHYLKLILDSIFCAKGGDFRNEIIWHYSDGTAPKNDFKNKHDVIFRYSKSKICTFNEIRLPVLNLKRYNLKDVEGRSYFEDGHGKRWYSDAGRACEDVWTYLQDDKLRQLNSMAKERLGYPTQKPEALLSRIIESSSNEDDVILDIYCGCGTSVAVAEKLNRKWIGIDITYQSISLIMKRLEDSFGKSVLDKITLSGVPEDFESAVALANKQDDRVRKEFEKWVILTYSNNRAMINDKKGGDGGIDGTAFMIDFDEHDKQDCKPILFSVKSNKTLTPSVVRDLFGTMEREKAAIGYLLTLYAMPNLVKESTKYGFYQNKMFGHTYPRIEVICVQEILEGKKMSLPTSIGVLKSAVRKSKIGNDLQIFENE